MKERERQREGEGLAWREGKFVMCCRMSVSAQASTFFRELASPTALLTRFRNTRLA